jgi:hypothetical protein
MACSALSSAGLPVMKIIGTSRSPSRTVRSSARPSMSGIAMSLTITSNGVALAIAAASRPSCATLTLYPAAASARAYPRAVTGSSSTTKTSDWVVALSPTAIPGPLGAVAVALPCIS